jgi:hypothetical protein
VAEAAAANAPVHDAIGSIVVTDGLYEGGTYNGGQIVNKFLMLTWNGRLPTIRP